MVTTPEIERDAPQLPAGRHVELPGRGTTFSLYFPRHEGSGPVGVPADHDAG